ncbi:MAG: hypothetical protein CVU03_04290 [Bacteroidetes bacterium HGW-Bacteroidetes-2]|nr:MAG: hypothetical protein CVU03_04290 [Bacteroidetes bacterium HGW-Bacteroidetes-2]
MKKTALYLMILLLSLGTFSTPMMASEKNIAIPAPTPKEIPAHVQNMLNRIDEIKEMDRSTLTRSERKELRKEVRDINKEIRSTGNGLYLSVGAIIIILLLIIIL